MTALYVTSRLVYGPPPCHTVIHELNAKNKRRCLGKLGGLAPSDAVSHPDYSVIFFNNVATGPHAATEQLRVCRNLVAAQNNLIVHPVLQNKSWKQ